MAGEGDAQYVKCLTAKEIKKLAKPEFAANPDKFYPTGTLRKLGYTRAKCKCGNNFWRMTTDKQTCGDSQCEGRYQFIGEGRGVGRGGKKKLTYAGAWESFARSLSTARIPSTPIKRYPVVARWRADVDYVAAGIFCFQPYCVTGELEPPANPLICPQFCLRFNDLDNIGLTGRHYSGFVMLGIQVFNKPGDRKFWMDECVEFNYRWLTEELGINPAEITFIEDVWAGGGNLGPSIEYFIGGLELGNMVFMQFKTFPDGSREELEVQVIDVGIGLERVPWLVNGSPTSYVDVFPTALRFFLDRVGLSIDNEVWERYGPLSCLLNVDEVEDLEKTWAFIAQSIGMPADKVKKAIEPIKDAYVVLDHTRTVLMAIEDGSLPSNVGGASNVRNILRRVFAILNRNDWWKKLTMDGLFELFDCHRKDLQTLYGPFQAYKSFRPIIELEHHRWLHTDEAQKKQLQRLLKKKNGKLDMEDWIQCVTSWGLPADTVATEAKTEIPGNLWYEIAERQERTVKALPAVLYSTAKLPPTDSLYYADHHMYEFDGRIVAVLPNVLDNNKPSVVVLDRSAFYPTSGGQEHDTGMLSVRGRDYEVVDVMKVGPCVLHVVNPPLPLKADQLDSLKGEAVHGRVDSKRREQLRNNHTATHIVYASCRRVLGPHVWQNGAKKTPEAAHLDITHFKSLTHEEMQGIENEANRIVHRCRDIQKGFMPKDEAEKRFGFHLYQGGIVPGNQLRVVNIVDTDTEACCGTHCDNTAEVGTIKITKSARISDGIVRLYYVAGENALRELNRQSDIVHQLTSDWAVGADDIVATANKFFTGYKRFTSMSSSQALKIVELQMRCVLLDPNARLALVNSDQDTARLFISHLPSFAERLKEAGKGVVFMGSSFLYGLLGDPNSFNVKELQAFLQQLGEEKQKEAAEEKSTGVEDGKEAGKSKKSSQDLVIQDKVSGKGGGKKGKKDTVEGVVEFVCFSLPNSSAVEKFLLERGFTVV